MALAEPPALPAPSSGNTASPQEFQEQLRDAHDSLGTPTNRTPSTSTGRPKLAEEHGTEKKEREKAEAKPAAVVPVQTPSRPLQLPLALGLELLAAEAMAAGAVQPGTQSSDSKAPPASANALPTDAVQPDPTANAPAASPGPSGPTDLSFALRLTPQENAAPLPDAANDGTAERIKAPQGNPASALQAAAKEAASLVTAVKATQKAELQPDDAQPAPRADALVRTTAAFQTVENGAPSNPQAEVHAQAAPAMKTLDAMPVQALDQSPKPAGPMKDLSIQVGQTQSDRVELRLVERAGELQVAVRAANPDVAQGLRQGLSDLSDRLEQNGFRAEAWRPGSAVTGVQGTGETRQRSTEFQNDGSPWQQGGSRQGQQQHSQQQGHRPRWVQELEGSLTTSSTGESYGIPR